MNKSDLLNKLKQKELKANLPLKDTAKNLVFGSGSPDTKIIFIGEAPGRFEDEQGLPFIGAAGKILTSLIETINLKREDVFITSVLHYRPPKNRPPNPDEIQAFKPYLDEIIEIINPKIIATLGKYSLSKFLEPEISKLHGVPQKVNLNKKEYTLIPLYHPAAVLYNRSLLKTLEEDFKTILTSLETAS